MHGIRHLLEQSRGTPLQSFIRDGLIEERLRALVGDRARAITIHRDQAAMAALARMRSHACCHGGRIFLGPAVGGPLGPGLREALAHELAHVAQIGIGRNSGRVSTLGDIEAEAVGVGAEGSTLACVEHGASPDEIYQLWWLLPIAAALYVLLRPGVANAPAPGEKTYPSVSEGQVAGEALALFAVPEASFGLAGRLGVGLYGSLAISGAASTMSYRGVGDMSSGQFSGVQAYVFDGATGAIIGVVVPGGIKLIGNGATRSLDWLATQGIRRADMAITSQLAQRSANSPIAQEELAQLFQRRGMTGKMADWWMDRRGFIVLYRGQGQVTSQILSPLARTDGVGASEALVARMRVAGMADEDIAHATAFWHVEPVPAQLAPPGLGGQPLGAVGIPTTRIPGIAANFPEGSVVYVIRMPKTGAIRVPNWGLSAEHEWVILNQLPREAVVDAIPATRIPALEVDEFGQLIPGRRGAFGATIGPDLGAADRLALRMRPRMPPLFGAPSMYNPKPKDPPGAGMVSENTICVRPNSDFINPVCTTYKTYMVKSGDTLWGLAARFYGDGNQYMKIYEANKAALGPKPKSPRLMPGQTLSIP